MPLQRLYFPYCPLPVLASFLSGSCACYYVAHRYVYTTLPNVNESHASSAKP